MPDAAAPPDAALRLVLFGPPGAGKTSLLGALPQAAEAQRRPPDGDAGVASPSFLDLRRAAGPPAGGDEVVPYSFEYEPGRESNRRGAVVLDCNGRASDALIRDPAAGAMPLGREALHADALLLAVDASASPDRLDADFAEFERFLQRMELERGVRTEVGGLPVFLVLTKCDRLARAGDTTTDWFERIEERKREIGARFHDFLAGRDALNPPPAFGRIRLQLWATAIRRPALAGAAAKPTEPYGVAELFRQSLDQATAFRARRDRSAHRLIQMTLAGAASLLVLLSTAASLVIADVLRRPPTELEVRVADQRRDDRGRPEDRLGGSPEQVRAALEEWRAIRQSPDFADLPPDLQSYVEARRSELEAYVPWREDLEDAPRPREALTEDDLRALRGALDGPLAPPRPGWDETEAGRIRRDRIAQADAMLNAVSDLAKWYQDAYSTGDDLWLSAGRTAKGPSWNGWADDTAAWLDAQREPPDADRGKASPGDPSLTYGDVNAFGSVAAAEARWEEVRDRLRRLRDAAAALGLIVGLKDKPDLLVMPSGMTLEQAAERDQQLQNNPDYKAALAAPPAAPPSAADEVRGAARANYELLLRPARELVLSKLHEAPSGDPAAPDRETRERWAPVREWLRDPKELAAWRDLAQVAARLADPTAPEPVQDLASFLEKDSFSIHIGELTLVLPDRLEPALGEPLKVYVTPANGAAPQTLAFKPAGAGVQVGATHSYAYRFTAEEPDRTIAYAPGDVMYAELPLTGRKTLRWEHSRSHLYRFETLRNDPVLLDAGQAPATVKDVQVQVRPENGVPKVPDLMPQVDLK